MSFQDLLGHLLDCTVCGFTISTDYYFRDGHLLCSLCKDSQCSTKNCAESAGIKVNIVKRQFPPLNELYNLSDFSCCYKDFGCKDVIRGSQIENHKRSCPFRPVQDCPFSRCNQKLRKSEYVDHLMKFHSISEIKENNDECIGINISTRRGPSTETSIKWVSTIYNISGQHFFLTVEKTCNFILIWLTSLGDTKNFQVKLSVHGEGKEPSELHCLSKIHSQSASSLEVRKSGQCILIYTEKLPKFMSLLKCRGCPQVKFIRTFAKFLMLQEGDLVKSPPPIKIDDPSHSAVQRDTEQGIGQQENSSSYSVAEDLVQFFLTILPWSLIIIIFIINFYGH